MGIYARLTDVCRFISISSPGRIRGIISHFPVDQVAFDPDTVKVIGRVSTDKVMYELVVELLMVVSVKFQSPSYWSYLTLPEPST